MISTFCYFEFHFSWIPIDYREYPAISKSPWNDSGLIQVKPARLP